MKDAQDAGELLKLVGLEHCRDKFPSQMSGGEQQRVSIARALAKRPQTLLGDEPTGALDSETGVAILKLLQKLCREQEKTVVLVTHNSDIAKCAGIVWLCPIMIELFAQWYIVPGLHPTFHPIYLAVAVAIVLVCVLSSYLSYRRLLKVKTSEALRPAAPKAGKRCISERLPFWRSLSFDIQYNLRDISRAKLRAFMGIMGTAVGMLLMIYGVGCRGMVGQMKEIAFDKTAPAEYQVNLSLDAKLSDVEELAERLEGELVMVDAVEVSAVRDASSSEKEKGTVTIIEGKGFYNILGLDDQITSVYDTLKVPKKSVRIP